MECVRLERRSFLLLEESLTLLSVASEEVLEVNVDATDL